MSSNILLLRAFIQHEVRAHIDLTLELCSWSSLPLHVYRHPMWQHNQEIWVMRSECDSIIGYWSWCLITFWNCHMAYLWFVTPSCNLTDLGSTMHHWRGRSNNVFSRAFSSYHYSGWCKLQCFPAPRQDFMHWKTIVGKFWMVGEFGTKPWIIESHSQMNSQNLYFFKNSFEKCKKKVMGFRWT